MTFKKLSTIPFFAILFVFGTYIYGSYKDSTEAPIANVLQEKHEPSVSKETKIAKEKKAEAMVFEPISESAPVPKVEPENVPVADLSWKEEQAVHQAEIDRLNEILASFPPNSESSDEYREIEEKILLEFQEMGVDNYQIHGGGGAMFTPNFDELSELITRFDPEMQNRFAPEISAVEDLKERREKIDAEMRANRRGELENPPELTERHQRLTAQEFRFAREHDQFFEELNKHHHRKYHHGEDE